MSVHPLTMLLALLTTSASLALAMGVLREQLQLNESLRRWLIGLVMFSLGIVAYLPQLKSPSLIAIAASSILLYGGSMMLLTAVLALGNRRAPSLALMLPIAALAVAQILQPDDLDSRRLLAAMVGLGIFFAATVAALQGADGVSRRSRLVLSASLFLGVIAFAMRIWAVLHPTFSGESGAAIDATHGALLMASILASSFAMVLIDHEREGLQNHRLATLDPQTGTYNRRTLLELGQRELARAQRRERPICVILMRVDPPAGGLVPRAPHAHQRAVAHLAELVASTLQRQDLFGRLSQDEFCAVLPDTAPDGGQQVAERLRVRAETVSATECGIAYTLTLHVAERAQNELSFAQLADRANHALRAMPAPNQVSFEADAAHASRASVRQAAD